MSPLITIITLYILFVLIPLSSSPFAKTPSVRLCGFCKMNWLAGQILIGAVMMIGEALLGSCFRSLLNRPPLLFFHFPQKRPHFFATCTYKACSSPTLSAFCDNSFNSRASKEPSTLPQSYFLYLWTFLLPPRCS